MLVCSYLPSPCVLFRFRRITDFVSRVVDPYGSAGWTSATLLGKALGPAGMGGGAIGCSSTKAWKTL